MTRRSALAACIILFTIAANAQSVAINTDGSQPATGAMLDIKHVSKGLLIPRIALTGFNDVTTVPDRPLSLLVYNTATTSDSDAVQPGYYFWNNSKWNRLVADDQSALSGWMLGGNKGTSATTHFIGTKDSVSLQFKVADSKAGSLGMDGHTAFGYEASKTYNFNNVAIGRRALYYSFGTVNVAIGDSTLFNNAGGFSNTAVGALAMLNNTHGFRNTALGYTSLYSNTTGSNNVATGNVALYSNTTGFNNTATGSLALFSNTTGSINTATGYGALFSNTTANWNTATGSEALYANTTGFANVAVGFRSLYANVSGQFNTAIGTESMLANVSGTNNTAIGYRTLGQNVTGHNNSAFGMYSLNGNTSGRLNTAMGANTLEKNTSGEQNVAIGYLSLRENTTGLGNTAIGTFTMIQNQTGNENTAIGVSALAFNTTGNDNTAIGTLALKSHMHGNVNVAIGREAMASDVTGAANTAVGYMALYSSTGNNFLVAVGNAALSWNSTGQQNTAIGSAALFRNTSGSNNTALGFNAGYNNTTASQMTAIGNQALISNTSGENNSALGAFALNTNTTGNSNTGFGVSALAGNLTGSQNTAIGYSADVSQPDLTNATAIGANAISGCSNCLVLGNNANVGINLRNPGFPLNFNNSTGDKISLWGNTGAHYGFGVQSGLLQIHADVSGSDIALGYGSSAALTENFRVKGNGNVIMGTSNPAATLKFGQSLSKKIILFTGGTGGEAAIGVFPNEVRLQGDYAGAAVTFGNDIAGTFQQNFRVQGNGDGVLRGNMYANGVLLTSDGRMKKDITLIDESLDKITKLNAYHYYWKESNEDASLQTGVIAQEVQALFPELVKQTENGTLTVNYTGLVPYLIQGVKEQQSEINILKKEVEDLKEMMRKLLEKQ